MRRPERSGWTRCDRPRRPGSRWRTSPRPAPTTGTAQPPPSSAACVTDDVGGGVADPGVDIAQISQSEQGGGVRRCRRRCTTWSRSSKSPGVGDQGAGQRVSCLVPNDQCAIGSASVLLLSALMSFPRLVRGTVIADPRAYPRGGIGYSMVITRAPHRGWKGCRPASREPRRWRS